jgi:hypothetical protein
MVERHYPEHVCTEDLWIVFEDDYAWASDTAAWVDTARRHQGKMLWYCYDRRRMISHTEVTACRMQGYY